MAMNIFRETLDAILQAVDGIRTILIVGVDGIIIDRDFKDGVPDPELSYELVAAEYTSLLKTSLRTAEDVETGCLQEMTILTERYLFIVRMITEEYFIMMVMNPDGNFGRARYEMKKAQIKLEKEFRI